MRLASYSATDPTYISPVSVLNRGTSSNDSASEGDIICTPPHRIPTVEIQVIRSTDNHCDLSANHPERKIQERNFAKLSRKRCRSDSDELLLSYPNKRCAFDSHASDSDSVVVVVDDDDNDEAPWSSDLPKPSEARWTNEEFARWVKGCAECTSEPPEPETE